MRATHGRVWEAASQKGERPALTGVFFDAERGTLTASDIYIAVRVPCEVEDGDESGVIPADALKAAGAESLSVRGGKATLKLKDGERSWSLLDAVKSIDFDTILAGTPPGRTRIGINPELLLRAWKALGGKRADSMSPEILSPTSPLKPIRLSVGGADGDALVMPIRIEVGCVDVSVLDDDERLLPAIEKAARVLAGRKGRAKALVAFRAALAAGEGGDAPAAP